MTIESIIEIAKMRQRGYGPGVLLLPFLLPIWAIFLFSERGFDYRDLEIIFRGPRESVITLAEARALGQDFLSHGAD